MLPLEGGTIMLSLIVMGIEDFHLSRFPSELLDKLNELQVQVLLSTHLDNLFVLVFSARLCSPRHSYASNSTSVQNG